MVMGFIRWSWENYWLTWRKSFDFRGMTTRSRFWSFVLVEILMLLAYALCFSGLVALVSQGKPISNPPWVDFFKLLLGIFVTFFTASVLPLLSCQTRRIRDATGRGAWMFLGLIPWAGSLFTTILSLYPTRKSLK